MLSRPAMVNELVLAEVRVVAAGYGALVGLSTCVSPHVGISVTHRRKLLAANFTWVRLFVSMHSGVDLYVTKKMKKTYPQICLFIESLAAWITGFWISVFTNKSPLQWGSGPLFYLTCFLAFCHNLLV